MKKIFEPNRTLQFWFITSLLKTVWVEMKQYPYGPPKNVDYVTSVYQNGKRRPTGTFTQALRNISIENQTTTAQ